MHVVPRRLLAFLLVVVAVLWGATAAPAQRRDAPGPPPPAQRAVVLPVEGPLVQLFRAPAHRYGPGHRGVDLGAWPGTPVRAALPGVVAYSGVVAGAGWITLDHGGGLETTYGVLDPRQVVAGRRVGAGDVLGRVAPGRAHVDWGVRLDGDYIDPLTLLGRWRVHLAASKEGDGGWGVVPTSTTAGG